MNPSEQIDQQISELSDWRREMMTNLRQLIHQADPEIIEEWKWGTAVFTSKGMVVALGAFKDHIKLNFFKGAALEDPNKLFNSGLEAKISRSIDYRQDDKIDEPALIDLIKEAVDYNTKE